MKRLNQQGLTIIELVIAAAILSILASSVMVARTFMAKQTVRTSDKAYAAQKAIQMVEELRALVAGAENQVNVLDSYSNGTLYDYVLTTDKNVDVTPSTSADPSNALSGNPHTNGHWRYLRQVEVSKIANDPNLRQVTVKIWLYGSDNNPGSPGPLLAETSTLLRTIASTNTPSQVMDVYLLAINNIAGWWVQEPVLFSTFQSLVSDIQGRNPGLIIRPHYITRSSYGRDTQYLPYINYAKTTDSTTSGGNIPYVYFYPGSTYQDQNSPDTGALDMFYDPIQSAPGFVGLTGNFNVDGSLVSTTTQFNGCPSLPVADMYNNGMRYPDELAYFQAVTQAAASAVPPVPASDSVTEMSERMLMEGLLDNPTAFTNAMIINLHGELLPLPPMRNYSDAAKDPGNQDGSIDNNGNGTNATDTNIRVVAHPELIYYPGAASSVTVKLRVYSYYAGLDDLSQMDNGGSSTDPRADPKVPAISLFFPDLSLSAANVLGVTAIIGNDLNTNAAYGGPVTYQYDQLTPINGSFPQTFTSVKTDPNGTVAGTLNAAGPVSMIIQNVGPNNQTLITLYNTRLRSTVDTNNAGLASGNRLYGLEYIPCSPEMTALSSNTNPIFTARDLTYANAVSVKNTARWIVSLSVPVTSTFAVADPAQPLTLVNGPLTQVYTSATTFAGQHRIETRIGNAVTAANSPANLSKTYVWTGNSFPPPTTEQFQFMGDPRNDPYLDVKVGGEALGGGQSSTIQANGYNWYFKNGDSGSAAVTANMYKDGYRGFGAAGDTAGWHGADYVNIDVPRYYQMWRQGLLNTTGIWTTMNGYTYYYFGMGGEFGSDQPPFSNGLTINNTLYNTTAKSTNSTTTEIIGTSTNNWLHIPSNTKDTWYSKTWLGELYPDSMYSAANGWSNAGNLPVATGSTSNSTFYRKDYNSIPTTVTSTISSGNGGRSLNGMGRTLSDRTGPNGCSAFYDGKNSGGGVMNHGGSGNGTDSLLSLGATCYSIFGYPMAPSVTNSAGNLRSWHIDDGGNTPPEWAIAPYNNYTTLSIPSVGATSRLFYNTDVGADWNGTGVVKITDSSGKVAYIIESGLAIAANVGTSDLGKTALVCMLRTFLDGGNYSGNSHITQVPLVALYCDSPIAQYDNPTTIALVVDGPVTTGNPVVINGITIASGPTSNIWYRYPGLTSLTANLYTEEYAGYPSLTASSYAETIAGGPMTLDMNILYSNNSGTNWSFIQDNFGAQTGILDTSVAHLIQSNSFPVTYIWSVPTAAFPQGNYEVEVEAFRNKFPLNYSYHQLNVTINR